MNHYRIFFRAIIGALLLTSMAITQAQEPPSAQYYQDNYLNLLVDILKQPPEQLQQHAAQSLNAAGEPAIPILINHIRYPNNLPSFEEGVRLQLRRAIVQSF